MGARPGVTGRGAGLILAFAVSESHWRIRFVCHLDLEFDVRMHRGIRVLKEARPSGCFQTANVEGG